MHTRKPIDGDLPKEEHLGYRLVHVEHALRRLLESRLGAHGVSLVGWAALSMVIREPGVSAADITRKVWVSQQAVSRVVAQLRRARLLTERARPGQARIQELTVTDEGRRIARRCDEAAQAIERGLRDRLGKVESEGLSALLGICVDYYQNVR